jgi:hypothetical protein
MDITRRRLFAGIAAVAGALATRAAPLAAPAAVSVPSPPPSLLDTLTAEIQWAHAELLAALNADDFGAWEVDSDEAKPFRFRLARSLVLSRDLDLTDELAATVNRELESLWADLARR